MDAIDFLKDRDNLQPLKYKEVEGYIHNDHRFLLPLVYISQEKRLLPKPCKLILFDAHHDSCPVNKEQLKEIEKLFSNKYSINDLIKLTDKVLGQNDDDWIQAGMQLNLFSDAIVFGVTQNPIDDMECQEIVDISGNKHHLEIRPLFPGDMLEYQCSLSDIAYEERYKHFWDLLDWEFVPREGFKFRETNENIAISIDLDAFTIHWEHFIFPWDNEVFIDKFLNESTYWTTQNWSGKKVFDNFIERCGMFAIAREPRYCGGEEKMEKIYSKVNEFLFNNLLIQS